MFVRYLPREDVADSGLRVELDGVACVYRMTLPRWSPTASWSVGFGARAAGGGPTRHVLRSLSFRLGARVGLTSVPLSVSVFGTQLWSAPTPFTYVGSPRVSSVQPSAGPLAGGTELTVRGERLHGTRPMCRLGPSPAPGALSDARSGVETSSRLFNGTYVASDGTIRCSVPPQPDDDAEALRVYVTTNGRQFAPDSAPFAFYPATAAAEHTLRPSSGPTEGGTLVVVPLVDVNATAAAACRADGHAACVFGGARAPASVEVDGSALRCTSPASASTAGSVVLAVTLNGQQLLDGASAPLSFERYATPRLDELGSTGGTFGGGDVVGVRLAQPVALAAGSNVTCRFGQAVVAGELLRPNSSDVVNCTASSAVAAHAAWQTLLDFECDTAITCGLWASGASLELGGSAALHGGWLRFTHSGAPYLSASTCAAIEHARRPRQAEPPLPPLPPFPTALCEVPSRARVAGTDVATSCSRQSRRAATPAA